MTVRLRAGVTPVACDQGLFLLDTDVGRHFQLNEPGAAVLTAMLDGEDVEAAAGRLGDGDREQREEDVRALLARLTTTRLVEPREPSEP